MSQIVKPESGRELCASENWLKVSAYKIPKNYRRTLTGRKNPDHCFGSPHLSSIGFLPVSFDGPRVRPQAISVLVSFADCEKS